MESFGSSVAQIRGPSVSGVITGRAGGVIDGWKPKKIKILVNINESFITDTETESDLKSDSNILCHLFRNSLHLWPEMSENSLDCDYVRRIGEHILVDRTLL